ncbi:MAG: hypothetical protein ACAH27_05935 [Xanthobacteraceae bacterium]
MAEENDDDLRDWFASTADVSRVKFPNPAEACRFVGIENPPKHLTTGAWAVITAKVHARLRYMHADAMMAERKRTS